MHPLSVIIQSKYDPKALEFGRSFSRPNWAKNLVLAKRQVKRAWVATGQIIGMGVKIYVSYLHFLTPATDKKRTNLFNMLEVT